MLTLTFLVAIIKPIGKYFLAFHNRDKIVLYNTCWYSKSGVRNGAKQPASYRTIVEWFKVPVQWGLWDQSTDRFYPCSQAVDHGARQGLKAYVGHLLTLTLSHYKTHRKIETKLILINNTYCIADLFQILICVGDPPQYTMGLQHCVHHFPTFWFKA